MYVEGEESVKNVFKRRDFIGCPCTIDKMGLRGSFLLENSNANTANGIFRTSLAKHIGISAV